ncbi:testis-expressed protein 11 [Tiliqua scincoides]|uniref:testis-expressed protein 11 n=1 Tax=Tiliqua scincoides TaxID=71010 RepID=UPI003463032A
MTHVFFSAELIQELLTREIFSDVSLITEKLFSEIEDVHKESGDESQKAQAEESAVSLWNWTVGRKISDIQRVKLRHVACRLMMFCEVSDPPEEMVRRHILMAMKTGKGWVDIEKPALANELLEIAMNNLEKLYAQLTKRNTNEADLHIHKADVERDVFRVLSYQAESAVAQGDFQKAVICVQRCKDILMRLPKETCYLSLLCYNFGIETYDLKRYEQSSFWLSQSYEIGKMDKKYSTGQEMQAKVLRLLATVYLEWDHKQYQEKALRAITMANEENVHPAGFFLKIKILLKGCASDEDIGTAVAELLHHKFSLDICLDTAKLLLEHEREAVGFDFLKSVAQLFEGSSDVGKAVLLHVEFLLQRMREPLAKKLIEDLIAGRNRGKQLLPEILNHFHLVLWDKAAKDYEANEAVKEAERCDPNSIFTQFYVYKMAVLENNSSKALDAVVAMGKSAARPTHPTDELLTDETMATSLLSLAAQFALENNQESVAMKALEYLLQHSQDFQQTFTALKCLIRLVLSKVTVKPKEEITKDMETLLTYLTTAHLRLDGPCKEGSETLEMRIGEAHWFRKIAWNLAVQCESCPRAMRDFFVISFKFSQFCPPDKAVLLAQRTSLLMAAAVDLDMGRNSVLPVEQQTELLTEALGYIQSCREIWKVLKQTVGDFPKDPTHTLLLLYEFEARAKLNDPSVGGLLDQVWELPEVEIKTLEAIGALAMEPPAHYPSVCKKALQMVLTLLRKQEPLDTVKFSKCLHSLVHLSLPSGMIEADVCALDAARGYFEDALSILDSAVIQASYPEVEILWLMTRAWNTGIYQYCASKYKEAEQWCGLGMRFLTHLGALKSSYESQMTSLYSEVLDKLDRVQGFLPKEE